MFMIAGSIPTPLTPAALGGISQPLVLCLIHWPSECALECLLVCLGAQQ